MWAHRIWGSTTNLTRSNQKPPTKHLWIQALASLRSQAPVFSGMSNQDSFAAMSASVQFKQHPSSTWTTCRRPLLHHIYAPACCSGQFFLHRHFLQPLFWICRVQLLPQGGEALHILFYISFSEFAGTSTRSNISYLVSLCLVSVALFSFLQVQPMFYFIDIFSTHNFLDFSHFTPRWKQKGKSSTSTPTFHPLPLLECTLLVIHWRGRGNFHVLFSGLKTRVDKVKFVKRNFCLEANYHQEDVIISSDQTMPHHRWQLFIKRSPLLFLGPRHINFITLELKLAGAARDVPGDHSHSIVVTFSLF